MSSTIVIDYGMGNLRSVQKAFERAGRTRKISSDPLEIAQADRVVIPRSYAHFGMPSVHCGRQI